MITQFSNIRILCGSLSKAKEVSTRLWNMVATKNFSPAEISDVKPFPIYRVNFMCDAYPRMELLFGQSWMQPTDVIVFNVLSKDKNITQLTKEEYNFCIRTFSEQVVSRLLDDEIRVEIGEERVSLEKIIPRSYQKLETWFELANQDDRFSHEMDNYLWADFLIEMLLNNEYLGADDYRCWLQEEKQLSEAILDSYVDHLEHDREIVARCIKKIEKN